MSRVSHCLQRFPDFQAFQQAFSKDQNNFLLQSMSTEQLVTSPDVPALSIARIAFGDASVKTVLKSQLFQLCQACGITSTPDAMDAIADDVLSGYGDLRITEVILAFKKIREGKFREQAGDRNRGEFYGTLSSSVICDCLYQYRFRFRNDVLAEYERRQAQQSGTIDSPKAFYHEFSITVMVAILTGPVDEMPKGRVTASAILNNKDMCTLDHYIKERKFLYCFKTSAEQLLQEIDQYNASHPDAPFPETPAITRMRVGTSKFNQEFSNNNNTTTQS